MTTTVFSVGKHSETNNPSAVHTAPSTSSGNAIQADINPAMQGWGGGGGPLEDLEKALEGRKDTTPPSTATATIGLGNYIETTTSFRVVGYQSGAKTTKTVWVDPYDAICLSDWDTGGSNYIEVSTVPNYGPPITISPFNECQVFAVFRK